MRPGDQDNSILTPFIRYKQDVDSTVTAVLDTMFGPSGFDPRRADSTDWRNAPQPFETQIRSILWSPTYHPARLRDLPQPVPNDLPEGAESIFTFEDAFEDLLAVSQDQPLPNIYEKLGQRKLLKQVFPTGEPSLFWIKRLKSQGLMPWLGGKIHERDNEPRRSRLEPENNPHDWDSLHSELARRRAEVWNAEPRDDSKREEAPGLLDLVKASLDLIKSNPEFEKLLEDMNRKMFEDVFGRRTQARGDANPAWNENNESDQTAPNKTERKHPETFDEWFDHAQSFQNGGTSSWDAFKKSLDLGRELIETISKDVADDKLHCETEKPNAKIVTEQVKELFENTGQQERAKGLQTLYKQHTEFKDGKWHTRTESITVDNEGNEIDRKEQYHVDELPQVSPNRDHDASAGNKSDYERGFPADSGEVKKPGWFWK